MHTFITYDENVEIPRRPAKNILYSTITMYFISKIVSNILQKNLQDQIVTTNSISVNLDKEIKLC